MPDLLVDGGLTHFAGIDEWLQVFTVHELAGRHLDIEAGVGWAHRVIGGIPVRHQHALKSPVLAQDIDIEVTVLRRVLAVDQVVGVHHCADMSLLHGRFEGGQIDFADGTVVDDGIGIVPQEFAVVSQVMLDSGADTLLLHAADIAHGDRPGEERIFAEVLKVAAIARRAVDVHPGAEHEVDSACASIAADRGAGVSRQRAVP